MHGLGGRGPNFFRTKSNDQVDSMPVALAKLGYDVWLGNQRGTEISQEHESLDWIRDEPEYWDYSFPELAKFDLTAMLETISDETDNTKIQYIGHSLGTTQMFYALQESSIKQLVMDKIDNFVALAPVLVPNVPSFDLSAAKYDLVEAFMSYGDLDYQFFGPKFEERWQDLCSDFDFVAGEGDGCTMMDGIEK